MKKEIKLKGATVVEVIVALIIIMVVFSLAMGTYVRIMNSAANPTLQLLHQMKAIAAEVALKNEFSTNSYTLDEHITVYQYVVPYETDPQSLLLHLEAVDRNEKHLYTYKEIIRRPVADETP